MVGYGVGVLVGVGVEEGLLVGVAVGGVLVTVGVSEGWVEVGVRVVMGEPLICAK